MLTPSNDTTRRYRAEAARWLPAEELERLRARGAAIRHRFAFSAPERQAFRRRKRVPPSEWAQRNRRITRGELAGRMMDMRITPHLAGILDAAALPFVRQITVCAALQGAKTTGADTFHAWTSVFAPGPILSVYPDEKTGNENMSENVHAMYEQSPALRPLLTGRKQDKTDSLLRLQTCWWRIAWAGSPIALKNRSIRYLDLQEVDAYTASPSKKETGTIELALGRVRAYKNNHKIFITSSPTTVDGNVWRFIAKETQAVFEFWVRCPHCTEEQLMEFSRERFWWPHNDDGTSIDRKEIKARNLARYICAHCGAEWTDHHRNLAIQMGTWRLRLVDDQGATVRDADGLAVPGEEMWRHLRSHRPASIGFIVPSWILYFVPLSEIVHDFLRSRDKSLAPEERFVAYQNFQNKHRALPWRVEVEDKPLAHILRHRDDRPDGTVPGGGRVAALLFGVDTQDNGFYYLIGAIGWGKINDQWIVRAGFVTTFEALAKVLWEDEYRDAAGNRYVMEFGLQDMMGHRTKEVTDFCLAYNGLVLPSIGKDVMTQPYTYTQKEYFPATATPMPGGGIRAVRVNTKFYKDNMAVKFATTPGDPGSIRLHKDLGDEFAGHMLAEFRNPSGIWEQIGSRPNHWWDCLCLLNCAADVVGIKYRARPEELEAEEDGIVIVQGKM